MVSAMNVCVEAIIDYLHEFEEKVEYYVSVVIKKVNDLSVEFIVICLDRDKFSYLGAHSYETVKGTNH